MIPTPDQAEQLPAHPTLERFVDAMTQQPTPPGVSYWLIHDRYRPPLRQAEAFAKGTSNARYGQSPHNRWSGEGVAEPWAGAAVDVYPILPNGNVSNVVEHYQPIAQLAAQYGLENLGTKYGWDWAHSQVPDWRDYPVLPDPDERTSAPPSILGAGLILGGIAYLVKSGALS